MNRAAVILAFALVSVSALGIALFVPLSGKTGSKTLDNLMTAYNGESNARAKYLAYADKADREGYGKVASLFRAAAMSEEIHLNNHAVVIQAMGGTPRASIELPKIGTTRENLSDAKNGESYERQTMYPQFIAQAEKEKNANAVRTFTYSSNAEAQHAKLYGQALDNLKEWKTGKSEFSVCSVCGYTVESKPSFAVCPVCATPSKLYKSVT